MMGIKKTIQMESENVMSADNQQERLNHFGLSDLLMEKDAFMLGSIKCKR